MSDAGRLRQAPRRRLRATSSTHRRGTTGYGADRTAAVPKALRAADAEREARRRKAAKRPRYWDVQLLDQGSQSVDVPPLELHRAFVGRSGEFRAGPVDLTFERLFDRLRKRNSQLGQILASNRIDRYVTSQALALFLVAPRMFYAVNRDVDFRPYATTFELADTSVGRRYWSRR